MKKIILLFVMVFAVAGVQAKTSKLYSNFQPVANNNNVSWNSSTNTLSVWGSSANTYQMFSFEEGTLSNFEKLYIPIDNTNYAHIRIMLMNGSDLVFTGRFGSSGNKTITLEGWNSYGSTLTKEQIATITSIRIGGYEVSSYSSESPCTISINPANVYLETAEYEAMAITTTITSSSDKDSPFAWSATGTLSTITNNLSTTGSGVIFGYANNNDDAHGSFNVAGYDNVTVNLSAFDSEKNASVRLLKGTGTSNVEFSTASGTLSYTKPLTFSTCASIKAGAGASNCQDVSSIVFTKEFSATSITDFNIAASSSSTVNYDRTFNIGQKSTVCLPFALNEAEVSAAGTFYELKSVVGTTLTFSPVTTTEAYKPYMFMAITATPFASLTNKAIVASEGATTSYTVGGYTFQGTLAHQTLPSGVYGYNAANGAFSVTTTNAVTIDAFRGYITNGAGARELNCIFSDGEVTGIETVRQSLQQDGVMYNLQGQRVGQSHKGLFIMNGRKYVVK